MPTKISPPSVTVDSMLTKCWLIGDQQAAFNLPSFAPAEESVSAHVSPWLVSQGYSSAMFRSEKVVFVQDSQMAVCLMNQALEFLQRSLCNVIGHYILAQKGLETWARITNYYASYFAIHSLLCLQGRTITRLQFDTQILVQVIPLNIRDHIFAISTQHLGGNPHHETPWKRYYEIYDKYALTHSAYDLVAKKAYITEPNDESIERNALNYVPFLGFQEVHDLTRYQEFTDLFDNYRSNLETKESLEEFLVDLRGYASDAERKYFARTLLKVALAADIILSIRRTNPALQTEWELMFQKWRAFLQLAFPNPSTCYLLNFVPLLGTDPA